MSNGPAEPRKNHFDGVIVATPLEMAGIKLPAEAQQRAGHGREWLVASLCGFCQVSNISDCSRDLATCLPVRKLNYSCQPFDPIPALKVSEYLRDLCARPVECELLQP